MRSFGSLLRRRRGWWRRRDDADTTRQHLGHVQLAVGDRETDRGARLVPGHPGFVLPVPQLGGHEARIENGDVAELHAPFTHQEWILREALSIGDGVDVNPSGGPLAANPMMAAGLIRIGEAAQRISSGTANRALAHATSGPCLQQNLVCVLEGE